MKTYKNVEMYAKNAPTGSYAAGCPMHTHKDFYAGTIYPCYDPDNTGLSLTCANCEVFH